MSRFRILLSVTLILVLLGATTAAARSSQAKRSTAADYLAQVDGAQALVGAVLYVDDEEVLDLSLLELLDDRRADLILFAPSNAAFEALLGLAEGDLDGASAADVADALAGLLPADAVAETLLRHVVSVRRVSLRTASVQELLRAGSLEAEDGSSLGFAVGAEGAQVNDATIVAGDVEVRNAVIHFIDSVL